MLKAHRESMLLICNGEPRAIARRDEKTRSIIFYSLNEMNLEDVEKMLNKTYDEVQQVD